MHKSQLDKLVKIITDTSPLAIAFSGGADSALLLKIAHDTLKDSCLAITVDAPYHLRQEIEDAKAFTSLEGIRHIILPFEPALLPTLLNNPYDRCYLCKKAIMELCLSRLPTARYVLADGTNLDDLSEHRPGRQALKELGVRSPLAEAGLTKADVRQISRKRGIANWGKPAQSCLLTRFPYNTTISRQTLEMLEQAEMAITMTGVKNVRLRCLGKLARIECSTPHLAANQFDKIEDICMNAGFEKIEIVPAERG